MQKTEKQIRDAQKLVTTEDYLDYIEVLSDSQADTNYLKKTIEYVSKMMFKKVKNVLNESADMRKKQSWWSKRRDKKIEAENAKHSAEIERLETENQSLRHRLEVAQQMLENGLGEERKTLISPAKPKAISPKVNSKQLQINEDEVEELDFEVVGDGEDIEEDKNQDDDCLDF